MTIKEGQRSQSRFKKIPPIQGSSLQSLKMIWNSKGFDHEVRYTISIHLYKTVGAKKPSPILL